MSVQTNAILRSYFNTGDKPTETQFANLIDTVTASNVRTLKYIVGVAGVTGCDHNFTSVANTTEQSIQLGGTTIIPLKSWIIGSVILCTATVSGAATATVDLGTTSGGTENGFSGINSYTVDVINVRRYSSAIVSNSISVSPKSAATDVATSVYFSATPSANWDTLTTGKWEIFITWVDNSIL